MEPPCMKMTLLVFLAVFAMRARSQTNSFGPYPTTETERCVCQPHITVNPPVCRRPDPVNSSGTGYNCTTVQEILRTVSTNQEDTTRKVDELEETVSNELNETRRKVDELEETVSANQETASYELNETRRKVDELGETVLANQETVSYELSETRRKVDELGETVSANQETVSSELQGIRRQLEELQVSVSTLVEFIHARLALPKDCSEIRASGVSTSGVHTVQPLGYGEAFRVYCDMETDGGGWTVFQRRQDGSVDFYLDFANYSRGFGNLEGEFWLGNDYLHRLTTQGEYQLRVDLTGFDNGTGFAVFESFSITDVSDNYRLYFGAYSGTAQNSLGSPYHDKFTTKDRDNDVWGGLSCGPTDCNCAVRHHGAWWFNACFGTNLNGRYFSEATNHVEGIKWLRFSGSRSLKFTEMKIRSKV